MVTSLDRDLRYATAPLHERGVYALLFAVRRSIGEVVALGRDQVGVVARVLGVDREEAATELGRLRSAGLLGEGLTLLAGVPRARVRDPLGAPTKPAVAPAELAALREHLAAHEGSRRALAVQLGCTEGALRAFESGRKGLGPELAAALGAYLGLRTEARTPECVPACVPEGAYQDAGTHVGTHEVGTQGSLPVPSALPPSVSSVSPLGLPSSSPSPSPEPTTPTLPPTVAREEGAYPGCVPSGEPVRTDEAQPTLDGLPAVRAPKRRSGKRPPAEPVEDPIPEPGSPARRVYDAIVNDRNLRPITTGPGELAVRLVALCEGTSVDPAREVIALGGWLAADPGRWKDGRSGLLRNIGAKVEKAARLPKPAPTVPGLTRDVSKGPLMSAELHQFAESPDYDFSEEGARKFFAGEV